MQFFNDHIAYKKRLYIAFCLVGGYLLVALVLNTSAISASVGSDSAMMLHAADNIGGLENDRSTRFMSQIFSIVGGYEIAKFLNLIICSFFIFYMSIGTTSKKGQLILIVLIAASAFAYMRAPHKETFLLLSYGALMIAGKRFSPKKMFLVIFSFLIFYAFMARVYYFLIALFFLGFILLSVLNARSRIFAVFAAFIIFLLIPFELLAPLQITRDNSSWYRVLYPDYPGFRTAFENILPVDDKFNFIVNYLYGIFRLNLPLPFHWTIKEIVHSTIVFWFFKYILQAYRLNPVAKVIALYCLANFCVLWFFEPDLGSYLRHFIVLLPLLVMTQREFVHYRWKFKV